MDKDNLPMTIGHKKYNLRSRLDLISSKLDKSYPVWDLCCDHGLLGLHAYFNKEMAPIHFVDKQKNIITQLEKKFTQSAPNKPLPFKFHSCDMRVHQFREPIWGNIIIAGIGFHLMEKILHNLWPQINEEKTRLFLMSHTKVELLKKLIEETYKLKYSEYNVTDRGKDYTLYICETKNFQ